MSDVNNEILEDEVLEEPQPEPRIYSVILDENGYYTGMACIANYSRFLNGVDVETLPPTDDSIAKLAYQLIEGMWFFDEVRYEELLTVPEEELQAILEANKTNKIEESKVLLAEYLETHPLTSNCHGGVEAQYSVTAEKQSLMASNYLTYTIAKQSGLDAELTWNATGEECEVWTEEEFVVLVLQIGAYVKPLVSLQQSYEVQIRNCATQEELDDITISYDIYGINE